jgi:alkanesulfonate monooxygenase SsuD/methylene tetrahydromethanopterin reductase-like flavin-dependent oxidoreductase (luciferase family)
VESTQTIAGTPDQVIATLGAFKDAGAVHLTGYFADILWGDSLELFAAEVIPALR